MPNETASADRRAAEYWRSVAQTDRSEARQAVANARTLTAAARREDETHTEVRRPASRARP